MTGLPDNLPDPLEPPCSPGPTGMPNTGSGFPVDPLDRALDQLEASVERQYRLGDRVFQDPIADMLDRLEVSIEGHQPDAPPQQEWLPDVLRQFSDGPPGVGTEADGAPNVDAPIVFSSEPPPAEGRDAVLPRFRGLPGAGRPERRGQGSQSRAGRRQGSGPRSAPRMIGRNTGIRHMGSDPGRYCRLREEWMSAGDCASCADFDPAEEARDDQCGGRCRHCHPDPDGESNGDSRQDDQGEQDE